jgi:hypothetical protein
MADENNDSNFHDSFLDIDQARDKGQLISKCLLDAIISIKKPTKMF